MYDTTVVLSVATSTILLKQRSWNSFKARKTAFSSSPANPTADTFLLVPVYVGDKPGGIWLSPTSLGTGGFLNPCV